MASRVRNERAVARSLGGQVVHSSHSSQFTVHSSHVVFARLFPVVYLTNLANVAPAGTSRRRRSRLLLVGATPKAHRCSRWCNSRTFSLAFRLSGPPNTTATDVLAFGTSQGPPPQPMVQYQERFSLASLAERTSPQSTATRCPFAFLAERTAAVLHGGSFLFASGEAVCVHTKQAGRNLARTGERGLACVGLRCAPHPCTRERACMRRLL